MITPQIEVLVPVAPPSATTKSRVQPPADIRRKRVGFRIEGSVPIGWHKDMLQRNFEIFMARFEQLLRLHCDPSAIELFARSAEDERDKAREAKVFDAFCGRIDYAILGIAG
jgi:hypothetical protein